VLRGDAVRYGSLERAFHWSCAALFFALVAVGALMVELDYYSSLRPALVRWHRAIGIVLFALLLARLAWRPADARPAPHPGLKAWERKASGAVHALLLFVLAAAPVTGYLFSASKGGGVQLPAGIEMPAISGIGNEAGERIYDAHYYLAYGGLAAAFLHAAAALKHRADGKPEILRRML